jgi:hypothetical protein
MNAAPIPAAEVIRASLQASAIQFAEPEPGSFVAQLPGRQRLMTACWLIVGAQGVRIEAFVVRRPDENAAAVHRWLLAHNARSYLVSWSIDSSGDIYLTGLLPLPAVTPQEIDRVLGGVLEAADSSFNTLLELGFGSSIRREWAWRSKRHESLANLAAFEGFVRRGAGGPAPG